jgi:hypothetical protein
MEYEYMWPTKYTENALSAVQLLTTENLTNNY